MTQQIIPITQIRTITIGTTITTTNSQVARATPLLTTLDAVLAVELSTQDVLRKREYPLRQLVQYKLLESHVAQ